MNPDRNGNIFLESCNCQNLWSSGWIFGKWWNLLDV